MTPMEFLTSRNPIQGPFKPQAGNGGLIPTPGIELDTEGYTEPEDELVDVLGGEHGDRCLVRGRVVDTFGKPLVGYRVHVDGANAVTTKLGSFAVLIPRSVVADPPVPVLLEVLIAQGDKVVLATELKLRATPVTDDPYDDVEAVGAVGAETITYDFVLGT